MSLKYYLLRPWVKGVSIEESDKPGVDSITVRFRPKGEGSFLVPRDLTKRIVQMFFNQSIVAAETTLTETGKVLLQERSWLKPSDTVICETGDIMSVDLLRTCRQ